MSVLFYCARSNSDHLDLAWDQESALTLQKDLEVVKEAYRWHKQDLHII